MKYLSLMEFMRMYGYAVKSKKTLLCMNWFDINKSIEETLEPFIITLVDDVEKEGLGVAQDQILYEIMTNNWNDCRFRYGNHIPQVMELPPVLEMEWLRTKLDLSDEVMDVLIQMSYFMVVHVMTVFKSENDNYMEQLEEDSVIIEIEDLEDTPIIVGTSLPIINQPKVKTWNLHLYYEDNLNDILDKCLSHGDSSKVIYYHLPFILSIFMLDYFGDSLKSWSSTSRIDVERKIKELRDSNHYLVGVDKYSYGRSQITIKDSALFYNIFTVIHDKLQEINKDLGIVSVWNYSRITGTDDVRASILLSNMDIIWDDEMKRAEEEKKNSVQISERQEGVL